MALPEDERNSDRRIGCLYGGSTGGTVVTSYGVDVLVSETCELGEGPLWDEVRGCLLWIDIPRRTLHSYHPGEERHTRHELPGEMSAVVLSGGGGLVFAGDGAVHVSSDDGARLALLTELPMAAGTRTNDGACDPHGKFWIGTADEDPKGNRGALFRVDPEGRIDLLRRGVSMSNGIGWSPDGSRAYHVDTRVHRVDELLLDESGDITAVQQFVAVEGMPDGLAVDTEGGIWVAIWDGHAVHRYSPSGTLNEVLPVPAAYVTSCAFGPQGSGDLFITTAAPPSADTSSYPSSGALFQAHVGVDGSKIGRFTM